jgi:hypothetical protein
VQRERDGFSLVAGLLFLAVAAAHLLGHVGAAWDGRWVWPVVLIGLGVVGLATAGRSVTRR